MVTEQAPLPEQSPLQALNAAFAPAVGTSCTLVPLVNAKLQVPEELVQLLIPAGVLLTEPLPVTFSVSAKVFWFTVMFTAAGTLVKTPSLPVNVNASDPVYPLFGV